MHRKWNKGQVPLRSGSFWWRSKTRETDNWHWSYAVHESHGTMYIFFYNHATGDDPLREGGWKIIQFGKTILFLCLSSVFWYTIFWKKCENSKGADPISVTSSANALKEGSWRALCFYRIIPLSKFPDFLLVSINYYDIWENKYWRYLEKLEEAFVEIYCDLMEYERYVIEYNSPRDIITYNIV